MDIPFNLTFYNHTDNEMCLSQYATSEHELLENEQKYTITVKENHDLSLLFQSAKEYRLEIDLFDILPDYCFTDEEFIQETNPHFLPSNKERFIYLNSNSSKNKDKKDYPMLVPGSYKIIITGEGYSYYAFLKVAPLRIEDNQLERMRTEIESYLSGLSKELRVSNVKVKNFPNHNLLHQTNVFINRAKRSIIALNNIINNPKYEIRRSYNLSEVSKSGRIDYETIRYKQRRVDIRDKLLTYENKIEYDIDENRMLKMIIQYLQKNIKIGLKYVEEVINRTKKELKESQKYRDSNLQLEQLKNQKNAFNKLKVLSNYFLSFPNVKWTQYVKDIPFIDKPRKLVRNAQYNEIYKLYLEIKKQKEIEVDPLKNYRYFWKESSKLYEIWGFIKLIEGIKKSKFGLTPMSGWIYEHTLNDEVLPFLDPNTRVVFENNDALKIILYYDSYILSREKSTIDNPVYTIQSHRRPDFRIDVYVNNLYYRTIIGDFKYRSYRSLETVGKFMNDRARSTVYKQLLDYSRIQSSFIKSKRKKNRGDGSAYETWVFYPSKINVAGSHGWDEETNIRRIELSPGKDYNFLMELLDETIEEIVDDEIV